jgi:hypothetical protein
MPEETGTPSRSSFRIEECRPPSTYGLFTLRGAAPGAVGSAWEPALGKVWEFIRSQPGLRTDGHNVFLYRHSTQPDAPIRCDFGVEVTRTFETAGEV